MNSPLIVDPDDSKWLLLDQVLAVTTSRRAKQEMAKQGVTPVTNTGAILRLLLIAIFFSFDIAYVIRELQRRDDLRRFAHIDQIPSADEVYRFLSRIDEARFVALINALLRTRCGRPKRRTCRTFIVDGSAITLDLNVFKKKVRKKDLENRDYKWGYSNTRGYYLGFKMTLVIEYPSLIPVAFLIHPGSPHDSRLFTEVLDNLKRRRILRAGDTVIADKGYYAYNNYAIAVRDYRAVPLIFPKKNFDTAKMLRRMNYPLSIFSHHDHRKIQLMYRAIVRKLLAVLTRWEEFPPVRSLIEDLFKLGKDAFSLRAVHRYSRLSVVKFVALNVLLIGTVVLAGVNQKNVIQSVAEW